jgi:hypothetical protein
MAVSSIFSFYEIKYVNVSRSAESSNAAVLGLVKYFKITETQTKFSYFDSSLFEIYKYSNVGIVEELLLITELYL